MEGDGFPGLAPKGRRVAMDPLVRKVVDDRLELRQRKDRVDWTIVFSQAALLPRIGTEALHLRDGIAGQFRHVQQVPCHTGHPDRHHRDVGIVEANVPPHDGRTGVEQDEIRLGASFGGEQPAVVPQQLTQPRSDEIGPVEVRRPHFRERFLDIPGPRAERQAEGIGILLVGEPHHDPVDPLRRARMPVVRERDGIGRAFAGRMDHHRAGRAGGVAWSPALGDQQPRGLIPAEARSPLIDAAPFRHFIRRSGWARTEAEMDPPGTQQSQGSAPVHQRHLSVPRHPRLCRSKGHRTALSVSRRPGWALQTRTAPSQGPALAGR